MQDILTEKEAMTRWCPLARADSTAGKSDIVVINRLSDGSAANAAMCIASECMAWRCAHKDSAENAERGYCGAFGLPRFT